MFLCVLMVARIIAMVRYGNRSTMLPQLLRFAAGSIPPLAVVAFFKLRFAPANDLMSRSTHDIISHATDFGRWVTTVEGFIKAAFVVCGFLRPGAVFAKKPRGTTVTQEGAAAPPKWKSRQ